MSLAAACGPFRPAVYHSVCVERSRVSTPERATLYGLSKEPEISQRIVWCEGMVKAGPSRAGSRKFSPASSQMPVKTPNQKEPAAAQEERSVDLLKSPKKIWRQNFFF